MNLIYSGYTYRTVDNFRPLLDELAVRGHKIGSLVFPRKTLSLDRNLELGSWPFKNLGIHPAKTHHDLPPSDLETIVLQAMDEFSADVILLDDMMNYPSNTIYSIVKKYKPEIPVIAFQHGFFQFWQIYRKRFSCDYLLVYGDRDKREFTSPLGSRVISFGLPKLSRLTDIKTSDDGSVIFVAQGYPRPEVVYMALGEYAELSGRKIKVRLHPEHDKYRRKCEDWMTVMDPNDDIIPHLASCHAVITTGSTAGFEAICLGKPVVSLPAHTSVIFRDSPCVALDYSGKAIEKVMNDLLQRQDDLRAFFSRAVNPLSFNMERAADSFQEICERGVK